MDMAGVVWQRDESFDEEGYAEQSQSHYFDNEWGDYVAVYYNPYAGEWHWSYLQGGPLVSSGHSGFSRSEEEAKQMALNTYWAAGGSRDLDGSIWQSASRKKAVRQRAAGWIARNPNLSDETGRMARSFGNGMYAVVADSSLERAGQRDVYEWIVVRDTPSGRALVDRRAWYVSGVSGPDVVASGKASSFDEGMGSATMAAMEKTAIRQTAASGRHYLWQGPAECGCSLMDGRCLKHQGMMARIYNAWNSGDPEVQDVIWSMQDGYGEPGFTPGQGYDFSGIRDSSQETVEAMLLAVSEFGY